MSLGSDTSFFITSETLRSLVEDAPADRGHDQERIINLISLNISEQLRRIRVLDIDHLALFLSLIALDSSNFSQIENDSSTSFSARGLLKICGRANYKKFGDRMGLNLESAPRTLTDPAVALTLAAEIWLAHYAGKIAVSNLNLDSIDQEFKSRGRIFSKIDFGRCHDRILGILAPQGNSPENKVRAYHPAGSVFSVWYGTNRRVDTTGIGYSSERDDLTHYGCCQVFVPRSHKLGSIGSSLIKRFFTGNDLLKLVNIQQLEVEAYWTSLKQTFEESKDDPKTALVFIHGYNVSFEAAAIRAAQIGYDLSAQRAMAFFSWPSQGKLGGYLADAASIEVSEIPISRFLVDFTERSGADKVHIIAHSMGNRGVMRAVSRIISSAQAKIGKRFGQIILAAADVDAGLFIQHAPSYTALSERTSIYVSSRDRAVEASYWLHEFPRVGLSPPTLVVDGIDTVNVANADMSLLGHGYFSDARNVLADLHELVVRGSPPAARFGLRTRRTDDGKVFWQVKA